MPSSFTDEHDHLDRKTRKDVISEGDLKIAEDFFKKPDISSTLPYKRSVSAKIVEPCHVLQGSLINAYAEFRESHPESSISFSKFAKLRPSRVKTMRTNTFNTCLCEYCANIELKLKALNREVQKDPQHLQHCGISDKFAASRFTLCSKLPGESKYNRQCIDRECDICGTHLLKTRLAHLTATAMRISWNKWVTQQYKTKKGRESPSKCCN